MRMPDMGSRKPWRLTAVMMIAVALLCPLSPPAEGSPSKIRAGTPPGYSPRATVYGAPPYFARDKGQLPPGFQNLSPEERGRMQRQYREWQTLPPDQKDAMRRRMDDWNRMPQQDRDRYQQRYQQWQQLSPEDRRRIGNDLQRWDQLSPQERNSIQRRFTP